MRVVTLLVIAGIGLFAATGTAVAAGNTAPLVDAGVDQTVPVDATVYLDANGSVDPDGNITRVDWTVETPAGTTTTPDCPECRQTQFNATTTGQYTVTLTATDDDGATRSDTLYVTVTNESGPAVAVSGPGVVAHDSDATFTANVTDADAALQSLAWVVDGDVAERESLTGVSADASFTHSFESTGDVPVRAVVYDTLGHRGDAAQRVSVVAGGGAGGGSGSSGCYATWCDSPADLRYSDDGEQTIVDTNNDGELQTYEDGTLVSIDPAAPSVTQTGGGTYQIDGGVEAVSDQHVSPVVSDSVDRGDANSDPRDDGSSSNDGGGGSDDDGGGSSFSDVDSGNNKKLLDGAGDSGSSNDGDSGNAAKLLDGSSGGSNGGVGGSSKDGGDGSSNEAGNAGDDSKDKDDDGWLGGFLGGDSNGDNKGSDGGDGAGDGLFSGIL